MIKSSKTAVKMYPNKPEHAALPDNYLKHAREIDTPVLFMTGRNNRVFADSNILCFNRLKELAPGNRTDLLILDGSGHQDPFLRARLAHEGFPQFLPFVLAHHPPRPAP